MSQSNIDEVAKGELKVEGEDDSYDFGSGAGFYVDATTEQWSKGYNMYTYITEELPKLLFQSFEQLDSSRVSITGHSMGGHGALTLVSSLSKFADWRSLILVNQKFLKNPGKYKSCSVLAPIANPINCPWGQKAFKGYFGDENVLKWKEHDATELISKWKGPVDILIDVVSDFNLLGAD